MDNLPLSKFFSPRPFLPRCTPPPPHPAFFINGSSWRSFSSIQGLLPFGVLISPDAHDTAKAVLETIALVGGRGRKRRTKGPLRAQMNGLRQHPRIPSGRQNPETRVHGLKDESEKTSV